MSQRIASYDAFWPYYLGEHKHPATRLLHVIGTLIAIVLLVTGIAVRDWRVILAGVIAGYAFAWLSHIFIERNRPATFKYPLWSLISDCRMLGLWLVGGLGAELARRDVTKPDELEPH
jgi:hypothetical protein